MAAPGVEVETDEQTYLKITYTFPKQILLTVPDWEDGVRDECVHQADKRGLMSVGEVMVGEVEDAEPDEGEVSIGLPEGIRLDTSKAPGFNAEEFAKGFGGAAPVSINMCKVTAEVFLMGSMGS